MTWGCAAAVLAVATSASAQTVPVYVSAGYAAGRRQPPATSHDDPMASVVHNLVFAAGARITPWLGVEGSVALSLTEQSVAWKQLYMSGCCTDRVTSDRDTTALVYFRFAPPCEGRMCIEGLAGTGFNVHHVEDLVVARSSILTPSIWVPVSGEPPTTTNGLEWTLAFGADFPVTLSQHFTVAPTVRILLIKRPQFITGWDHRGPHSGSGLIPTVGVSLTWRAGAKR
jgi:hypothetical protein